MTRQVLLRWQAQAIANLNGVAVFLDGRIRTIHPVQAGAPGHCETEGAHIATDREGIEGMTNPIDAPHADTPQGRQAAAALAIAKMCGHDLPEITSWRVDLAEEAPVEGHLSHCGDLMSKLAEWRRYLGADEPRVRAYKASDSGCVEVFGSYRGPAGEIGVRIWHGVTAARLAELNVERRAS